MGLDVRELRERVRMLELENDRLMEHAEDTLLLGAIAEQITARDSEAEILETALERASLLKDIPWCAFGTRQGDRLALTRNYFARAGAFPGQLDLPLAIETTMEKAMLLEAPQLESLGWSTLLAGVPFRPTVALVVGTGSALVPGGAFLFVSDATPSRIPEQQGILRRVVEFVAGRLDLLTVLQRLEALNSDLDRKVADRTRELEALHKERLRLQEQLAQAQKMEAVGRLAGGIAHDFNNMLGVILGFSDLALARASLPAQVRADLTEIRSAAVRSADLTGQLLAFARKQTINPRVLDLNGKIDGLLKMMKRLMTEDVEVTWRPALGLWPVKVDPIQVDQILANLLVNARDSISGSGVVTVSTENRVLDAFFCGRFPDVTPGEYVHLAVSDNGCGMTPEILEHIFEPFFTTKEQGRGTGLGLATVYGIVQQNHGFIDVESESGRGTTFHLFLPRAEWEREAETAGKPPDGTLPAQETILVVEDEPQILLVTKAMLENLGYRVLSASSAEEAVRCGETRAGEIRLLLTDVVMPGMNGYELSQRLTKNIPGLPCVFMSGYSADITAHRGVLQDGARFLQKPFTLDALARMIREALDRP